MKNISTNKSRCVACDVKGYFHNQDFMLHYLHYSSMVYEVYKKAIVLGDSCCGKSALIQRFVNKKFSIHHIPTTFQTCFSPWITVKAEKDMGQNVRMELALWDTPGCDELSFLRQLSYPDKDVALVCFSISDPESFQNVKKRWIPELNHYSPGTPVVLVGLKKDLRKNKSIVSTLMETHMQGCRPISTRDAEKLSQDIGACAYIECSARSGKNVSKVFYEASKVCLSKTAT